MCGNGETTSGGGPPPPAVRVETTDRRPASERGYEGGASAGLARGSDTAKVAKNESCGPQIAARPCIAFRRPRSRSSLHGVRCRRCSAFCEYLSVRRRCAFGTVGACKSKMARDDAGVRVQLGCAVKTNFAPRRRIAIRRATAWRGPQGRWHGTMKSAAQGTRRRGCQIVAAPCIASRRPQSRWYTNDAILGASEDGGSAHSGAARRRIPRLR